jgi:hypothetical protein
VEIEFVNIESLLRSSFGNKSKIEKKSKLASVHRSTTVPSSNFSGTASRQLNSKNFVILLVLQEDEEG